MRIVSGASRRAAAGAAWLPLAALCLASAASAQPVATDIVARQTGGASFGDAQQIQPGLDGRYAIPEAQFGDRPGGGGNLFFSFDHFDLATNDTAVFQGAPADFVISRVTDGSVSQIYGRFRSEIPGADHIFVNPAGVTFGPGARIDVPASFHVGSSDLVRFGEGDQAADWDAHACCTKLASALPPSAFGFATLAPGDIHFDRMQFDPSSTGTVAPGETLSAIGGNVRVTGTGALQSLSLVAQAGAIQLGALPGSGDAAAPTWVPLDLAGFEASEASAGAGTLTLENAAYLYTTSDFSGVPTIGRVVVRAGHFEVLPAARPSVIESGGDGSAPDPPPAIDVEVAGTLSIENGGLFANAFDFGRDGGSGGDIRLAGAALSLDASQILIRGGGAALPGEIGLDFDTATLEAGALIQSWAEGSQQGGAIVARVGELVLRDAAELQSLARSNGAGGDVRVDADRVSLRRAAITAVTHGAGRSGDVEVTGADSVEVAPGALIATATLPDPAAPIEQNSGDAGSVRVVSGGLVRVQGDASGGLETEISARAISSTGVAGAAGDIAIEAGGLEVLDGARVTAASTGGARAGDIAIDAQSVLVAGRGGIQSTPSAVIASSQAGGGPAGSVTITGADRVEVADGGKLSVEALDVTAGPSGDLVIEARKVLVHGGAITTESRSTSSVGGDIAIRGGPLDANGEAPRAGRVDIFEGRVSTATTFEGAGALSIASRSIVVQKSVVESRAGLAGGALGLDAKGLFVSGGELVATDTPGQLAALDAGALDSLFDASSRLDLPGALELTRPNDALAGRLVALPEEFYAAEELLRNQCEARSAPVGSLTVRGSDRIPPPPDEDLRIYHQGGE